MSKQHSLGRVAVIIGSGGKAANRGPCQCLPFGTLIARSRALQLLAVPSRRFRGLRSLLQCTWLGAGSNLAAVCQPILESQRQSLPRQHSPPPSCASSGCLSMGTSNHTGRNSWAFLHCVSADPQVFKDNAENKQNQLVFSNSVSPCALKYVPSRRVFV